jgi:hypothetical protein
MATTLPSVNPADQEILNILREQDAPVSPNEVTKKAKDSGLAESEIFSAIWYLIDRGKVKLTLELKLEAV